MTLVAMFTSSVAQGTEAGRGTRLSGLSSLSGTLSGMAPDFRINR